MKKQGFKRVFCVFLGVFGTLFFSACGKGEKTNGGNLTEMKSVEEVMKNATSDELCGGSELTKLTAPFYETQIQYNEGFILLEKEDGNVDDVTLLFPVAKILEIRSNDLKTLYEEGVDYEIVDGKIRLTADSAMKAMPRSEFFYDDDVATDYLYNDNAGADKGKKPNTDKMALYPYRYAATYIRTKVYEGYVPEAKGEKLSGYAGKVKNGEKIRAMYVGDSIGTGAGASGEFDLLADLLGKGIALRSNGKVEMQNASVGGLNAEQFGYILDGQLDRINEIFRDSATRAQAVIERYAATTDVVFISFGANDCAGSVSSSAFAIYTCRIIDYFRDVNPDVSVVLVSSMDINPKIRKSEAKGGANLNGYDIGKYADELLALESEYDNLISADIFRLQKSILERKTWEDVIADNLNHPCDYMQRIYVQGILAALAF